MVVFPNVEEYRGFIPPVDERHYLEQIAYTISDYQYQAGKESGFPYMIQKIPILAGKTEKEDMPEEYCVEYEAGGECGYIMCADTVPREEDFTEKEFYIPCPFRTGTENEGIRSAFGAADSLIFSLVHAVYL